MAQHMAFPVAAWLPEDLCPALGSVLWKPHGFTGLPSDGSICADTGVPGSPARMWACFSYQLRELHAGLCFLSGV